MKTISNNTVAIISDLLGTIQNLNDPGIIYPDDSISSAFIATFGIRSLTANALYGKLTFPDQNFAISPNGQNISQYKWHGYKNDVIIEHLKTLFTNCHIISFADWSDIYGASDLWDGLLLDIIKPLRKKDFEFIFYLG